MKPQLLAALSLLTIAAPTLAQQTDVETRAMRDEMARSTKLLHLDSTETPYYVQYKIVDATRMEAQASFGALVSSNETRTRFLTVSVRVGNYDLDSSNFSGGAGAGLAALLGSIGGTAAIPIDDNYDELRRRIWLATDTAYKKAVEDLSGKKAALASKGKSEDPIPDFSKESARQETETLAPIDVKLADAEHLVRTASAVFKSVPMVESSDAAFEVTNATEHYLNSEGTSYVRQVPDVYFHASATMQNSTGEIFSDSCSEYGRARADIPAEATLVQESQAVAERLTARRKGKVAKRYNGPVLFEGDAAAELFAHHFANLLSSHPASSGGAGGGGIESLLSSMLTGPTASLLNKVGSRVLPDFLTVTDNPTLTTLDGHALFGNYKFDEEGVPSRETTLIKDGMLKTLLTSRTPARGMLTSTGNMRAHGVLPGNLFVDAAKTSTHDELRKQLADLIAARGLEYAYILRRLQNNQAIEAIRLYPDGHTDTVRDARIAEITANSFKDILAVSKDRTVYTERALTGTLTGLGTSADLITYVVPDMLFEDMTVEHVTNETPKLPDIPSPLTAN
jgi:predicted Zn-dependent protease